MLLDSYEKYLTQVGLMKKFKKKKAMWFQISEDVETAMGTKKSWVQCENRYNTIIKRKRSAIRNNLSTGASPTPIPYENELARIISIDDSIEPEVVRGAGEVARKPSVEQSCSEENTPPVKRQKALTCQEILLKIHEDREVQRERRHKELMSLMRELLSKSPNDDQHEMPE